MNKPSDVQQETRFHLHFTSTELDILRADAKIITAFGPGCLFPPEVFHQVPKADLLRSTMGMLLFPSERCTVRAISSSPFQFFYCPTVSFRL